MSVRVLRQILWALFFTVAALPVSGGAMISMFNIFLDTIAIVSAHRIKSEPPAALLAAGVAIFFVGIVFELGSETQRLLYKRDPATKGKPYVGGLFSVCVHANYFGYTLWRIGIFLTSQAVMGIPFVVRIGVCHACRFRSSPIRCFCCMTSSASESQFAACDAVRSDYLFVCAAVVSAMPDKERYCLDRYGNLCASACLSFRPLMRFAFAGKVRLHTICGHSTQSLTRRAQPYQDYLRRTARFIPYVF